MTVYINQIYLYARVHSNTGKVAAGANIAMHCGKISTGVGIAMHCGSSLNWSPGERQNEPPYLGFLTDASWINNNTFGN